MNPERFGPYRFESLIGRGGMGEVFRAWDERRNRVVALKRLPRQMAQDREFRARFQRESALAAKLREPHIIPIHDYGEIDGLLYIDMRLVEGTDLAKVLKVGKLGPERAVDVMSQVADALDAAHAEGLIHRDVKPSNILLVGPPERAAVRGFAYLADFGIASTLAGGSTLSRPGLAIGTAAYMAPERMSGERADARADVYSMACMFFECLTGHRPFPASDLLQALRAHLTLPRPRPSEHGAVIPPALDDVVTRGMAKNPDERYSTAGDLAEAARAALVASASTATPEAAPEAVRVTETEQALPVVASAAAASAPGTAISDDRDAGPDEPPAAPYGGTGRSTGAGSPGAERAAASGPTPAVVEDPGSSPVGPRSPSLVKSYVSPSSSPSSSPRHPRRRCHGHPCHGHPRQGHPCHGHPRHVSHSRHLGHLGWVGIARRSRPAAGRRRLRLGGRSSGHRRLRGDEAHQPRGARRAGERSAAAPSTGTGAARSDPQRRL